MGVRVGNDLPIHPRQPNTREVRRPGLDIAVPCRRIKGRSSVTDVVLCVVVAGTPMDILSDDVS